MASVKTCRGSFCWSLGHVVKWSRSDGTIEIKEVKEKLNISGAMVLNYVKQGKIKHVVPPGRKHGYYLEKDVEKLASELQAFLILKKKPKRPNLQ
ncbi:hypothetical protein KSC_099410 [Ktedonobacter sp. SOSP1-52]|uniref:hypothetical protein n=1 Tax=Ktedonobacter sp. SOSP1-52 TaxID=2778366 RepID=UPI001916BB57|nr:hypothetical protein [Ktedonobacter sp. SOSP1-52]GHO71049.1 hypothetical protein KSC_099410 [Ktedonobacter sp. SOSP1-52]